MEQYGHFQQLFQKKKERMEIALYCKPNKVHYNSLSVF